MHAAIKIFMSYMHTNEHNSHLKCQHIICIRACPRLYAVYCLNMSWISITGVVSLFTNKLG